MARAEEAGMALKPEAANGKELINGRLEPNKPDPAPAAPAAPAALAAPAVPAAPAAAAAPESSQILLINLTSDFGDRSDFRCSPESDKRAGSPLVRATSIPDGPTVASPEGRPEVIPEGVILPLGAGRMEFA